MNDQAVSKVWSIMGLAITYLAINILLNTQGSEFYLPGPQLKESVGKYAASVYGVILIYVPLIFFFLLSIKHAKKHSINPWSHRIPIAFNLEIDDMNDSLYKYYQIFFYFLFYMVPIYCCGHFIKKLLNGTVVDKSTWTKVAINPMEHLFKYSSFFEIFGNNYQYDGMLTFFPFWQPWISLLFFVYLAYLFIKLSYLIFRQS